MPAPLVHVTPVSPVLERGVRAVEATPEQVAFIGNTAFNLRDALDDDHSEAMAILADGKIVGFYRLDLRDTSTRRRDPNGIVLRSFVIDHRHQRRGLGTLALKALLRDIEKRHPDKRLLLLAVHQRNAVAMRLFRRHGFLGTGEAVRNARDGLHEHVLMRFLPKPGESFLYV